jgi:hypothetical protein
MEELNIQLTMEMTLAIGNLIMAENKFGNRMKKWTCCQFLVVRKCRKKKKNCLYERENLIYKVVMVASI